MFKWLRCYLLISNMQNITCALSDFAHLKMSAHMLWWLVICDFITFAMMVYQDHKMLGPSDFVFKSLSDCNDVTNKVTLGISQKKFNRTTNVLDITVGSTDYEIGDNLIVEIKGSLKKDGGFKPGAYYYKETVCKLLEMCIGEIVDEIFEAAGIDGGCPIQPGNYLAANFYFDNEKFTIPQVYGNYKTEILIYLDGVVQSCFIAYYDLNQKTDE